jgi:hypothetical protein
MCIYRIFGISFVFAAFVCLMDGTRFNYENHPLMLLEQ